MREHSKTKYSLQKMSRFADLQYCKTRNSASFQILPVPGCSIKKKIILEFQKIGHLIELKTVNTIKFYSGIVDK